MIFFEGTKEEFVAKAKDFEEQPEDVSVINLLVELKEAVNAMYDELADMNTTIDMLRDIMD